jgi:AMP phosphorylase
MKLKIKLLEWSAGVPVAMLNQETANELGIKLRDRISIETSTKEIYTIVDTIGKLIKKDEIAISSEIKKILDLRQGQKVDINLALPPESLNYIKKKLDNKKLSYKEIKEIIKDIVNNSLSEAEIALFISAMHKYGLDINETVFLIKSILETGSRLKLNNKFIADKHSIGGIAGRTTPIVVSICSAAGLTMPKTSSRAITTPAGTADAIETIAKVDFTVKQLKKIIQKTNAFMVWGGGLGMVPADNKIIQVEKLLNMDSKAQFLASIMSKKLAVGSKYILIHIPYGKTAKVNKNKALDLEKRFKQVAKRFNQTLECVLTKNKGPIGNGVGPALEIIDVIKVLNREDCCYKLEEESLLLSGKLLELTKKAKKGKGEEMAKEILNSGKAFEKFKEIIKAQGGNISCNKIKLAKYKKDIHSSKSGKLEEINNKKINLLARLAGCPTDKGAGLYLYVHSGDRIKKGEKLFTIYSESKHRLKQAMSYYKKDGIIKIK